MMHPAVGEVEFVRSKRAQRITLRVLADGVVRLTCPQRVAPQAAWDFLESKIVWIERVRQRIEARQRVMPVLPPEEEKRQIEVLRRAAKADLPARLERLAQQSGLKYAGVTIRAARSKWGSCSSRNTISLNLFLMNLPEHLRDFVLLHELCHTVHHNHSPRFHALLNRLTDGREQALNRELRQYTLR